MAGTGGEEASLFAMDIFKMYVIFHDTIFCSSTPIGTGF